MEIIGYKDKHEYTNKNGVTSVVYLMDCMELLKQIPDKYFELAVVDPPYGIGAGEMVMGKGKNKKWGDKKSWDSVVPDDIYFDCLLKTGRNIIVWGGNYFSLPKTGGWLFWDKMRDKDVSFADGELAWTNFLTTIKKIPIRYDGFIGADTNRIHPTQKPVRLYEWIFKNYAKPNDKILDTHLGSGSSRIAADKANLPFVGCELDSDYFYASVKRFNDYSTQQTMF